MQALPAVGGTVPIDVVMPRLSDQMEEATILRWLRGVGDAVEKGDELVEVETDKATVVYEAEAAGVVSEILAADGAVVQLGAVIARIRARGENEGAPGSAAAPAAAPTASATPSATAAPAAAMTAVAPAESGRPRATPVARRTARELGFALATVQGTGPGGRIVRADVRRAAESAGAAGPAAAPAAGASDRGAATRVPLTATQRTIARRMVESTTTIPHFQLTVEIDMTKAVVLRAELKSLRPDDAPSLNDLVVKAVALALREFPSVNASFDRDAIVQHGRVNVGVAVATDDALLVPTIFDADRKSIFEIGRDARALAERVRSRAVTAAELGGGTFTVSNLGMLGIRRFTAVINPPQLAILAVGEIARVPVFDENGAVVARDRLEVTLSSDHRVIYGADGARFLGRVRELLERPLALAL